MVALGVTREVKDREDEVGEEVDRLVSLVPVRARANRLKPKRRKCGVLCVGEGVEGERPEGKKRKKEGLNIVDSRQVVVFLKRHTSRLSRR